MPWRATDPMNERVQFIGAYLNHIDTMTELCERFGIRRNTGYKWVRRYTTEGLAGLQEKPRAPHCCPHAWPRRSRRPSWRPNGLTRTGGRARSSPLLCGASPTWHSRRRALQVSSSGERG